jgi:hypothetical protein
LTGAGNEGNDSPMSVEISSFHEAIRFLIQDFDPDVPLVADCTIDSAIRFVVNSGAIKGYAIGSDNESIIPYQSSSSCWQRGYGDWGWDNYAYQYGYGSCSFAYGNYYNLWYDQAFMFMLNYQPPACPPSDNDLTPLGNQEGWRRLCAECALWFVSGMVEQSFKTRSTAERTGAPKELLYKLEFQLDAWVNRGKMSRRPMPLPIIAVGVQSWAAGLWNSGWGGLAYYGFDYAF